MSAPLMPTMADDLSRAMMTITPFARKALHKDYMFLNCLPQEEGLVVAVYVKY